MAWKSSIPPIKAEWVAIAATIALLPVAFVLGLDLATGQAPSVPDAPPSKYDSHLIELDRTALERAYSAQLQLLFATWLRDDISATHRVTNGLRIARKAYIHAADQLEKRANEVRKREGKQ